VFQEGVSGSGYFLWEALLVWVARCIQHCPSFPLVRHAQLLWLGIFGQCGNSQFR